jgi:hypothetical protein
MLTEPERARFNELRNRGAKGKTLTADETEEIAAFIRRIEKAEAAYLLPATERLRRETEASVERTRSLEALAEREERLLERLSCLLAELKAEREEIAAERARLLSSSASR